MSENEGSVRKGFFNNKHSDCDDNNSFIWIILLIILFCCFCGNRHHDC